MGDAELCFDFFCARHFHQAPHWLLPYGTAHYAVLAQIDPVLCNAGEKHHDLVASIQGKITTSDFTENLTGQITEQLALVKNR